MYQEDFLSEIEALDLIMEAVHDEENKEFREIFVEPIIQQIEDDLSIRNQYIQFGVEFIEANANMLAKEYPTDPVSFPKRYVDRIIGLFGWETAELKKIIDTLLKTVPANLNKDFRIMTPTNFIHTVVLCFSDMKILKDLRSSARQQLSLCIYREAYIKYFKGQFIDERIMAYTFGTLNNTWGIVQSENVMNWLNKQTDVSYAYWKTRISLHMSLDITVRFLGRLFSTYNQSMKVLRDRFEQYKDSGHLIGADVEADDQYVQTDSFVGLRDNIIRLIRSKDGMYWNENSRLYTWIAEIKNVKANEMHDFATNKIELADIEAVISGILYTFITRDGFSIKDIQKAVYINRITNFPTQIDRAFPGKPVIIPLAKKYDVTTETIKAYIVMMAGYINQKMNEIRD